MNQEWKIDVKLTVEDIFFFLLRHSFSTLQGKLTWGLGVAALIGAPIVAAVGKDAFTAIVFLLVALIYLVISPLSLYTNAKRQMISNSVFKHKIMFTMDSEMLQIKQYTGEVKLFWHQLDSIHLNGKAYLLYVNNKQAFILPKRCIAEEHAAELENLLKEKQEELLKNQSAETGDKKEPVKAEEKSQTVQTDSKTEKAEMGERASRKPKQPENSKTAEKIEKMKEPEKAGNQEKQEKQEKLVTKEHTESWGLPEIKSILIRNGQNTGEESAAEVSGERENVSPESSRKTTRPADTKKKSEPKKKNADNRNKNK